MKRKRELVWMIVLMMAVCLLGCTPQSTDETEPEGGVKGPVSITDEPFDKDKATEMIKELEQPLLELSQKFDVISMKEFAELENRSVIFTVSGSSDILEAFFDEEELKQEDATELHLYQGSFVPLIFHEGIEITDAFVQTVAYEDERFNTQILHIDEKYTGSDASLKEFSRTYLFMLTDDQEWQLIGDEGTDYFMGGDFHWEYLPLK